MTYLAVQVGAAGGSAHGGASPPAYSAGSGCPPGPKARVSPGRLLSDLMLRLLASLSPFVALRFLPLPCVRFSPVLSTSFLTPLPGSFSSPFHAYLLGIVPLPRFWFSPLPVRFRFSSASSPLPPVSFPFLPLPFVQFSPVLSTLVRFVLPPSSRPLGVPTLSPVLLPDPGFRRPFFGARLLWPAGRAEAPPHHSTGAAKVTGMVQTLKSLLYPSFEASQSTGNGGLMVLTSCENQALWSCLRRSIRRLRRSSSDAVSDDSSARLAKTPASIK